MPKSTSLKSAVAKAKPTAMKKPAKPKAAKKAVSKAKASTKAGAKKSVVKTAVTKAKVPKKIKAIPSKPELREVALNALEDLKAVDIKVLEVAHLTTITDTMIVCTGTSNRHVKSLADSVLQAARSQGYRPLGVEGLNEGEWVLVNLNGVLVHVMQAQTRAFYQLEKLWDLGPSDSRSA